MPNVDEKFERHRELVVHQARGDEDALGIAQVQIAMADCVVAEGYVIAVGDKGLIAVTDRQGNEVVSLAFQCRSDAGRNGGDHAVEVEGVDRDLAQAGVTDAIGSLRNRGLPDYFARATSDCWSCLGHPALFYTEGEHLRV